MKSLVAFALGFVSGWVTRSTVESSRGAAVGLASTAADLLERLRRAVAIEGDYLEDFVAEVRSRVQDARGWRESPAASSAGHGPSAGNGGGP
jgi:hypothetical protein